MVIPKRIPGLKIAAVVLALFGALWITLEGELRWSAIMAVLTIVVASGYMLQRLFGGKNLNLLQGLGIFAILGILAGLLFTSLTLLFMVVKTGLHGHGPEFSQNEIMWILDRVALWVLVGLMAAVGTALLLFGFSSLQDQD